jgi:hypothetical protein
MVGGRATGPCRVLEGEYKKVVTLEDEEEGGDWRESHRAMSSCCSSGRVRSDFRGGRRRMVGAKSSCSSFW